MGTVALGSAAAPGLVALLGPRPSFIVVGAILPVLTLLSYASLSRLDAVAAPPALDLIDGVPMLQPLSLAAKERLARSLIPLTAEPGQQIIRTGDEGDRFYILAAGTVDVDTGGRHAAMTAPDSFGEIALLRDTPRTATVTATTEARLYALEREPFLAAVTGNTVANTAGQAVVEARLAAYPASAGR
jgi:CRP-like cAMP-binding protein